MLPIESGRFSSLLCWRSRVVRWVHEPISEGMDSRWLYDMSKVTKAVRAPIVAERLLNMDRKIHISLRYTPRNMIRLT